MADDLEKVKKKRTALRALVSRLLNKIDDSLKLEKLSQEDRDELEDSRELLIDKKTDLKNLDEEIHKLIDVGSVEADVVTSEEYQEKCCRCIKRIGRVLGKIKTSHKNCEESTIKQQSNVKLPKLTLEKYSGDPKKFTEFWNSYESTIGKNESLNKVEKFAYLKTLLTGAASNVVASLELNEQNYDECVKNLKERFGKKEIIVSQFMNKLLNLEAVKSEKNIKGLRRLYDEIDIAIRNLEAQGVTKGSFGQLLMPVVLKCIPEEFVLEFNRKNKSKDEIGISDLLSFIKWEVECREATYLLCQEKKETLPPRFEHAKHDKKFTRNVPTAATFNAVDGRTCIFCDDKNHDSRFCNICIDEKLKKLRNDNRCFICFRKYHISRNCRYKRNCLKCGSKSHNESICTNHSKRKSRANATENKEELSETQEILDNENSNIIKEPTAPCNHVSCKRNFLLPTCSVLAYSNEKIEVANLMLDSGSTRSFIHADLAEKLNLKVVREEKLSIFSFGREQALPQSYPVVEFYISDQNKKTKIKVSCLVSKIISSAPLTTPSRSTNKQMKKLGLLVAESCSGACEVGILIGVDYFWKIVKGKTVQLSNELHALSTVFGWIPSGLQYGEGGIDSQHAVTVNLSSCVENSLRSLWSLDLMGISGDSSFSNEEREIQERFEKEIRYEGDRYSVGLLWKSEMRQLENNFEVALKRFRNLRNRLTRNPEIFQQYKNVIEEQIKEGIVEECSQEKTESSYYMPHREIIKPNETTSCRIVYDASSSRSKGVNSLNDILDAGPNLSPLVLDIMLKFRKFEIAFSGDIAKAFLMIGVLEKDRDFLRFLWFGDNEQEYKTLRFKRLPFGLCCSPAILAMTIKYHIKKFESVNPECYEMLNSSLYVDDLFYGSDSIADACRLSSDAVKIFKDAGMNLRKLRSNSEELNSLWIEEGLKVGLTNESKFLGMIWIPEIDEIKLNCTFLNKNLGPTSEATKRVILQTVASVYDPIGVSQPFIIKMKILLQKIWTLGLDWDEALPSEIKNEWVLWRSQLNELERISLPRKYFKSCKNSAVSLHVFADASPRAYGAVAYFRYLHDNENYCTSFIAAKGRVAPLKPLTLPRLELMAALIAAKLTKYLSDLFPELCKKTFLWSDSQITLHWIKGSSRSWKPFVANRVSDIQSLTDPEQWFHCSGKENPADLLSRGEDADNLVRSSLWSHGPSWLSQPECDWPMAQPKEIDEESVLDEKRSQPVNALQISDKRAENPTLFDLSRFSRLLKVYRITAYVMRFINNVKRDSIKLSGQLSSDEILNAELHWVNVIQRKHFEREISDLSKGKSLEKISKVYPLNPFLDENGLLRLKGRLHFSDFEFDEKHPLLLPYKDYFSQLVIWDSHNKLLHAGVEATLAQIREKFWIIKGRQCVKSTLSKCCVCKRYKARPGTQETAPLPPDRILMSPPFSVTGLDYAGPFFTKGSEDKHYLLLFTCATTRALHLELVPSMTTEQFMLAFRRFISRRGLCSTIYSDNAKTFKRADIELKKLWKCIRHPSVQNLISSHGIKWKYIVEKGAWWGGFWERHFRTIKTCLRKIVGRSSLSLKELETLFSEIEAMINSRPITYIYDDPSEPSPLTPAHFLIGKRLLSLPVARVSREDLIGSRNSLVKRYKHQQNLLNHFWYRWRKHYLLSLRSMNVSPPVNVCGQFKVNDIVLVHDDRHPRNMWTMGKIIETHPGRDGKIRSCLIKTANGNLRRPVQLLYNLEVHNNE